MNPTPLKTALISGASIAGLATAYWLTTLGYRVTVVELAATTRPGGAAINVEGDALASAKQMGIFAQLQAQRLPPLRVSFVDAADVTPDSPAEALSPADEEPAELEIERDNLLAILRTALPPEVEFIFSNRITALHETPEAMHVAFQQGPARVFDLVVGCDGLHSGVRRLWFGPEADYAHFLQHYASITTVDHLLLPENTAQLYNVPGKGIMVNAYRGKTDIIFWFFADQELSYDYRDMTQQRQIVQQEFAGLGWRTAELLAEVQQADVAYFDKFSQIKLPSWTKGRVALVGDAAYCASPAAGIGASLALRGAAALAAALATHAGQLEPAFATYNQALRPFVEQTQATAVQMLDTFFIPKTEEAIRARNAGNFMPEE